MGIMAERQGFEPWVPLRVQRISNPSRSTTPAPLHFFRQLSGDLFLSNGLS